MTKELTISSMTNDLSCSFAGGCLLELTSDGLSSLLDYDSENNFVSICDERCEFVPDRSDSSKAVCELPKMSTVYSNANFKIETEKEDLRFRKVFGNLDDNTKMVFDGLLTMFPTISNSESECFVGGSFKAGHVGMLSQVKYFMGNIENKNIYVDKLKFQGSDDKTSWTDLFAADENIHEGWNYHNWETSDEYPKYRFYRLYNSEKKGCLVSELKM